MLEVLVCNDYETTKKAFLDNGIEFSLGCLLTRAMQGDECLGYCLYKLDDKKCEIIFVTPDNDKLMADGLLRSALHVACQHGITEAFYTDERFEKLFESIGFIEDKKQKKLKLNNLYSGCCHCEEEKIK